MGESEFWRFSLSVYGDEAVAAACLRLQDEAGADVNLLLFLLWRASHGRSLSAAEIAAVEEAVSGWREQVVMPLRGVRRRLKQQAGPVAPQAAEALRGEVKRIELEAERLQQEAMAPLAAVAAAGRPAASSWAAAEASFAAYAAVRGRALPQELLTILLEKLAERGSGHQGDERAGDGHGA